MSSKDNRISIQIKALKNWYAALSNKRKLQFVIFICLVISVVFWSGPILLLTFVGLCLHEKDALKTSAQNLLVSRSHWLTIGLPVILFFSVAIYRQPAAYDDLLRNIVVWQYNYDYRNMFPNADIYSWSLWYGFDRLLGFIGQYLEPKLTMWLVQAIAAIGMLTVLYFGSYAYSNNENLKTAGMQSQNNENKIYWSAAFIWLAFVASAPRLALGRPEIFMSIWLVGAILPKQSIGIVCWTVCGFALSSAYWLAFLYFPAVILLRVSNRGKLAITIALVLFHLIFWSIVSHGEYIGSLQWLKHVLSNEIQEGNAGVSENFSLFLAFFNPFFLLVFSFAAGGTLTAPQKPWPLIALVIYFFISNQLRYIATVAPLLAILACVTWNDRLPSLSIAKRGVFCGLLAAAAIYSAFNLNTIAGLPAFKLPNGAKVLTSFGPATYGVVFNNPGTVQVAPSFAFGSSPQEVQRLSLGVYQGKIDCAGIQRWLYSHIIENTLIGPRPECLNLIATQQEWRLWEVQR